MPTEVCYGARVRLHLRLTREDGEVLVDSRQAAEPLELVIGSGELHPNLEQVLIGVREGEREDLWLRPEQAFGTHDPALVREVPRALFSAGIVPAPGQVIAFDAGEGETPGTVIAVGESEVRVDLNHPAAGHPLHLEAEILSVTPPGPERG